MTQAEQSYTASLATHPKYTDNTPRPSWSQLGQAAKASWSRNPKVRWYMKAR